MLDTSLMLLCCRLCAQRRHRQMLNFLSVHLCRPAFIHSVGTEHSCLPSRVLGELTDPLPHTGRSRGPQGHRTPV